ncbi:MAG: hypothetical protein K5697_00720 [Lachnospiraceae bacterium]|nr:hypothetical protein [Lachnospiraceae bacterium]
MAIKVRPITCPNCGASVSYDESKKTTKCEFCGAALDMTEEYGPKMDRMRDDMQDMQIRKIMKDMNGQNSQKPDTMKARKKALTIILTIVGVYFFLYLIGGLVYLTVVGKKAGQFAGSRSGSSVTEVEVDPFDKLKITYSGISGRASARLSDSNEYDVRSLKKTTTELEDLSNGDTITVTYDTDKVTVGKTRYVLTRTEKTYTVSGLDEYVSDVCDVGEEDYEILKKGAIALAKSQCDSDFPCYVPDSFALYAVYTLVKKDYSDQETVFVVSFDYAGEDGSGTGYFMAEYSDITRLASGEYRINFNPGVYIYSRESYYGGFTLTSGHTTWDATYADVYLNNKADWFICVSYKNDEL